MSLKKSAVLVVGLVLFVVVAYAGTILALTWPVSEFSIEKSGTFGDSFGVVTSVFSGLAFAGIILTILLQRQELTESREIFRMQRFEGSFYRLLDLCRRNLDDVIIIDQATETEYEGVDALNFVCRRLNQVMQKYLPLLELDDGRAVYEVQLYIEVQKLLHRQARYLGTLQSLLELIERDLPEPKEREPYWDIVASQITSSEARYIFYCCLVSEEGDRFRILMHSSDMIGKRLRNANLSNAHRSLYARMHGVEIERQRVKLVTPYTRGEIKQYKRQAKAALRKKKELEELSEA